MRGRYPIMETAIPIHRYIQNRISHNHTQAYLHTQLWMCVYIYLIATCTHTSHIKANEHISTTVHSICPNVSMFTLFEGNWNSMQALDG